MSNEHIQQIGAGSIGKAIHKGRGDIVAGGKTVGTAGPKSEIDDLLAAIDELRRHLDDVSRTELDAAVREIRPDSTRAELEGPLARIAGIAVLLGTVGGPVISAVQTLLTTLSG
ncbi:hypothetical protein [Streptosporangium sp. NPDC004631]